MLQLVLNPGLGVGLFTTSIWRWRVAYVGVGKRRGYYDRVYMHLRGPPPRRGGGLGLTSSSSWPTPATGGWRRCGRRGSTRSSTHHTPRGGRGRRLESRPPPQGETPRQAGGGAHGGEVCKAHGRPAGQRLYASGRDYRRPLGKLRCCTYGQTAAGLRPQQWDVNSTCGGECNGTWATGRW
jgi:hypothetical protein